MTKLADDGLLQLRSTNSNAVTRLGDMAIEAHIPSNYLHNKNQP